MGDLISRQAAIDAIKEFKRGAEEWKDEQEERSDIWHRADSAIASALEIGLRIKGLPSEQPGVIRCKDCKYGVDYYHKGDCYCLNPKWGMTYFRGSWEFYCAEAERIADDSISN